MPKVRLQHSGKTVSLDIKPDAGKVTNHNPLRFRVTHGVEVNAGLDTWFMNRKQVTELQLEVLTEILEAKQTGSDVVVNNAEARVAKGQLDLLNTVNNVGHLTHPDVMMLIDMRQNPNQYVNSSSAFAGIFNALSRKVMDLSFYATYKSPQLRTEFLKTTGNVTRGLDQFVYATPNASRPSPFVNFSVIPAGNSYEEVRFPTYYDSATQSKKQIPKPRFLEIYAFYVNELFNCYRRYLRMLKAVEVLPGGNASREVNADAFVSNNPDGPGGPSEAVLEAVEADVMDSLSPASSSSSSSSSPEAPKAPESSYDAMAKLRKRIARATETTAKAQREFAIAYDADESIPRPQTLSFARNQKLAVQHLAAKKKARDAGYDYPALLALAEQAGLIAEETKKDDPEPQSSPLSD